MISSARGSYGWPLVAMCSFFPLAAILHHAIFYQFTCILQPLTTTDYSLPVIARWLSSDPSPVLALGAAMAIFVIGRRVDWTKLPVLAFVIAFAPLTMWIWDIPFSGRIVCRFLHDGRAGVHTRHLYVAGVAASFPTLVMLRRARTRLSRPGFERPSA